MPGDSLRQRDFDHAHGAGLHVGYVSVEFDNDVSAVDIEIAVAQLDTRMKQTYPMTKRIFIEGAARHVSGSPPPSEEILPQA